MTLAVSQGAAEASPPLKRLPQVSLCPPPACPPSPQFRSRSAVPISGHGHQHLTLAHLLQGTRQAVEVPVVLLQSFPEVQDHTRRARFGGKVVQVPGGGKQKAIGLPGTSPTLGNGESTGRWEDSAIPQCWV